MPDSATTGPGAERHRTLLTYSVLTGLTPLIPLPLADNYAKDYFRRRLVTLLAKGRGVDLSSDQIRELTREPGGGCLGGCVGSVLLFPIRKLFRLVFFLFGWKRVADLASWTYHYGYLVDTALAEGLMEEEQGRTRAVASLRDAIVRTCREAPIKPVERAVRATLMPSRETLSFVVDLFATAVRGAAGRKDADTAFGEAESSGKERVGAVADLLQRKIGALPDEHFEAFRSRFRANLEEARSGTR